MIKQGDKIKKEYWKVVNPKNKENRLSDLKEEIVI